MYYVYLVREGLYEVTETKRDDEEFVSFRTDNTAHIVETADWYITQKRDLENPATTDNAGGADFIDPTLKHYTIVVL
ncbi:hypothetical protein NL517_27680 [Klebsiella pneumoniae]|uniref:hypothetical protein n=1 Tax=Klebsiella pneumoniae complex TaxID=3390273 RepID=UPI000E2BED21|nr:hypothetical protein [Klebsiella pneumoniae]HBQ5881139.1 hypothetical protein [Klebsiella pneumoniae subsp. pneumoniae]HCA9960748.1 hypothetical protein [Klebsiella quasipneumoniae subsp. quasipneumoniae]MCP6656259.1 hypothetical protein [Klebsiella pneumoniae]MCP6669182.1 hypothetical protein [Klebsiella pneumoniae]VVJ58474.1 Uncharacterised protein [Klebsiella pneumoniae]